MFTTNYIKRQVAEGQIIPSAEEVTEVYEAVKRRWQTTFAALRRRNEAYTRAKFLDPTLLDLGWSYLPEGQLPVGRTQKRPDYCMFLDEQTERQVAPLDELQIFRAAATVLEAKKVHHPLDQISTTETPGWFPSQQVQDYLRWATDDTGTRFFRWAALSNGNEWRLYSWDAAPDAYFAFQLAHDVDFCPLEDFRLFFALFRPHAFDRDTTGRCLLDGLRDESLTQQLKLETSLRRRIFDVLEDLAEGYFTKPENRLTETDLPEVYNTSLIVLYRLLFVLYAEGRGLLPARPYGPGSNRRYRQEFSLTRLIDRLRDQTAYPDDAFDGLYDDILRLFHLINGTNRQQNERLGVTRYNGGLFNSTDHQKVEEWRVGESTLANVLRQLVFAQPPTRRRVRQQSISTTDTIDYTTLEVRQLGDIYEGLLGGHLGLDDDQRLQLLDERGENQRHGIFYTPDWIVQYLVRETLDPLLDDIESSISVRAARIARSTERQRDNSFAHGVLRLSVVDPAMGSGHFLVRATEHLAQRVFEHPSTKRMTEPVVANGQRQRSREQILAAGRIPIPPGVSQEQAELAYWRRRVVESCIYGVDTNPLGPNAK